MSIFNLVEIVEKVLQNFYVRVVVELDVDVRKVQKALQERKGCQECRKKSVRFGYPNEEKGSYCAQHKLKGMVDLMKAPYPELRFKNNITRLKGTVEGKYQGNTVPVTCRCEKGHICKPIPNKIQQGRGMCRQCINHCPIKAEKEFRKRIIELGGTVEGEYKNKTTPVFCKCKKGHFCYPCPENVRKGQGICRECARMCPLKAEKEFRKRISELGGIVKGKYRGADLPVNCICKKGHLCTPTPGNIRVGHGICLNCARLCPIRAEREFRERIDKLGGKVEGDYKGSIVPVACICREKHLCFPRPNNIQSGQRMCPKCNKCSNCEQYSTQGEVCHSCGKEVIRPFKKKELRVLKHFEKEFATPDLQFDYNRRVGRYFPDFLFHFPTCALIVEVDEHQHRSYGEVLERKRMIELQRILDQPCIFLRYNPDSPHACLDYLVRKIREYSLAPPQYDEENLHVEYLFYKTTIIFEDQ